MRRREVVLSPEARADLIQLYEHVSGSAGPTVALRYIERIETHCRGFDVASERGLKRDDVRPGLRVTGFERRLAIAFTVDDQRVTILRIFHGGQDWERKLEQGPSD